MFSRLATLGGMLTTLLGTLVVVKRINREFWTIQLVLNEFSWVVSVLGVLSAWRSRSGLGRLSGMFGAMLAFVPITRIKSAREDMAQEMQTALGDDYEQHIHPEIRQRLTPATLSLSATFGGTYKHKQSVIHNVSYHDTPSRTLKADIYRPLVPPVLPGGRYPAVIAFHGGGWHHGDKGEYFDSHHHYLAAQGYVVIDVQYRFTAPPDNIQWSGQLDDARAAIRWVKSQAHVYHIDVERIALLGRSAGAHIALSAAYRACEAGFEDTKVQAVVSYYAPINMFLVGKQHDYRVLDLFGGVKSEENPDLYADASPLEFADKNSPPTLLIHGYSDGLVSPVHAELLMRRLRYHRVPSAVLRVPWGRHAFDFSMAGLGAQLTQYHLDRFFAWALYHSELDT